MSARPIAVPFASRLARAVVSLARLPSRLRQVRDIARSRRSLARLDEHLLRDIGLSPAEASAEADRRGWDAPSHWKG